MIEREMTLWRSEVALFVEEAGSDSLALLTELEVVVKTKVSRGPRNGLTVMQGESAQAF